MSKAERDQAKQLAAARATTDRYDEALSVPAKSETEAVTSMSPDMQLKMQIAKKRMKKYHAAYRELAK